MAGRPILKVDMCGKHGCNLFHQCPTGGQLLPNCMTVCCILWFRINLTNWIIARHSSGWWFGTWFLFFPSYWECHHPNWRSPSFFRGVESIPPTRHPLWLWIATTRPSFRTPKHFHKKSDSWFPTKHGSLDTKQHLYLFSWLYPKTACWFPFNKNWIHVRGYRFFTTRPTGQRLQVSKTILIWLNHHCFIDEITMCVKTET